MNAKKAKLIRRNATGGMGHRNTKLYPTEEQKDKKGNIIHSTRAPYSFVEGKGVMKTSTAYNLYNEKRKIHPIYTSTPMQGSNSKRKFYKQLKDEYKKDLNDTRELFEYHKPSPEKKAISKRKTKKEPLSPADE